MLSYSSRLSRSYHGPASSAGAYESCVFASPHFSFLSPVLFIPDSPALSQVIKYARFLLLRFFAVSLPAAEFFNLSSLHSLTSMHVCSMYQSSAEKQNQWDRLSPPLIYLQELAQVMWRLASLRSVGQTGRLEAQWAWSPQCWMKLP